MKTLDYIILVLIIVGALNWGLIGFFQFDLVRVIFGNMSMFSRIIYAVVGLSGLYAISYFGRIRSEKKRKKERTYFPLFTYSRR